MPIRQAKKIMIGNVAHVAVATNDRGDLLKSRMLINLLAEYDITCQIDREPVTNKVVLLDIRSLNGTSSLKLAQALRAVADELQKQVNASSAVFEMIDINV